MRCWTLGVWSRKDSNLHRKNRNLIFYPLNYATESANMRKKSGKNKSTMVEGGEKRDMTANPQWDRLESVIRWQNMTTKHFSDHIGLSAPENLYRIKRGLNGISRRLATLITASFPEINPAWLLTGRGEMFAVEGMGSNHIGYYDMDLESNIARVAQLDPNSMIVLPSSVEADFAMIYRGDAMGEVIPANTIVVVKREGVESVVAGREYVVESRNFTLLRIVRSGEESNMLRLVAGATERYDDIMVSKSEIRTLHRVVAKLIVNY